MRTECPVGVNSPPWMRPKLGSLTQETMTLEELESVADEMERISLHGNSSETSNLMDVASMPVTPNPSFERTNIGMREVGEFGTERRCSPLN